MQNLPPAEIYVGVIEYSPWKYMIKHVLEELVFNVPPHGKVLDLMCGPGHLAALLKEKRPDIRYLGIDLEPEFIAYAKERHKNSRKIRFRHADAQTWETSRKFDAVISTGGVHHIHASEQERFILRMPHFLRRLRGRDQGFVIIADPYLGYFVNPMTRRLACLELGNQYVIEGIQRDAPPAILKSLVDIISNDLLLVEWKVPLSNRIKWLEKHFRQVNIKRTWPMGDSFVVWCDFTPDNRLVKEAHFGDYCFVLWS